MAAVAGVVVLGAIAYQARAPRVRFDRATPWATSGVWLRADTHTHTSFSDGQPTVDQMADRAVANGCDVLAITDHTDGNLRAATPEYHAAIWPRGAACRSSS